MAKYIPPYAISESFLVVPIVLRPNVHRITSNFSRIVFKYSRFIRFHSRLIRAVSDGFFLQLRCRKIPEKAK